MSMLESSKSINNATVGVETIFGKSKWLKSKSCNRKRKCNCFEFCGIDKFCTLVVVLLFFVRRNKTCGQTLRRDTITHPVPRFSIAEQWMVVCFCFSFRKPRRVPTYYSNVLMGDPRTVLFRTVKCERLRIKNNTNGRPRR